MTSDILHVECSKIDAVARTGELLFPLQRVGESEEALHVQFLPSRISLQGEGIGIPLINLEVPAVLDGEFLVTDTDFLEEFVLLSPVRYRIGVSVSAEFLLFSL